LQEDYVAIKEELINVLVSGQTEIETYSGFVRLVLGGDGLAAPSWIGSVESVVIGVASLDLPKPKTMVMSE